MKKFALFLCVIVCLPLVLSGCGKNSKVALSSYHIVAQYDDESHILEANQVVEYVNNSNEALSEICFFLYPNAFAQGQQVVSSSYNNKAYPHGESFGGIEFSRVCESEKEAAFEISDEGNILTVNLSKEVYPDERVKIEMEYVVSLANIRHRLGYCDETVNFGNFFPIACVYENGFVKNEFSPNGDPFYSDMANFDVQVTVDSDFVVANTGKVVSCEEENGKKVIKMVADNVRDFCFSISKQFKVVEAQVDKTKISYYFYDDENAQHHLETAVKAVKTFNELFGDYSYSELAVVKSGFCFGGMEYPMLVLIADDLPSPEEEDYVIVHEIAHQWWYGMVGNNEFESAWVDEGLTEFSTALFYEENSSYGLKYDTIMDNALSSYQNFVRVFKGVYGSLDESMNRTLTQFPTEPEYVNCTYTKGMLMFDSVRSSMSDRKFFKCLKNYFEAYKFKNSSAEKLIASFCKTAGRRLEKFFASWVEGKVKLGV